MKRTYFTAGPVPLPYVAEAISSIETQGWINRYVLFAGIMRMEPKLFTPGKGQDVPSYAVISYIDHEEGTEPAMPKLVLKGA